MDEIAIALRAPAFVDEPGGLYLGLIRAAREAAARIAATPGDGLSGSAAYIHRASAELLKTVPSETPAGDVSHLAAVECLRRLVDAWPRLAEGAIQGEQILAGEPTLWKRAMTEWPMGGYASMAADLLIQNDLLGGNVLELGAGVGSCSALVAAHVGDGFIRSDLQPFLLRRQPMPGSVARFDFNAPGPWSNLDTIFAVNAVHCAREKGATLGYLRDMLRPGGVVVLGEGAPYTDVARTPWALNAFLGLFRGWWDVGGFLSRDEWTEAFSRAGFSHVGHIVRRAGAHDLGGLIWAQR